MPHFIRFLWIASCLCLGPGQVGCAPNRVISVRDQNRHFSDEKTPIDSRINTTELNTTLHPTQYAEPDTFTTAKTLFDVPPLKRNENEAQTQHFEGKVDRLRTDSAHETDRERTRLNALRFSTKNPRQSRPTSDDNDLVLTEKEDWYQELLRDGDTPAKWCKEPSEDVPDTAGDHLREPGGDRVDIDTVKCPRTKHCGHGSEAESGGEGSEFSWARAPRSRTCGEGLCCCCKDDLIANCSGHGDHLRHIPKLPASVSVLIFTRNGVTTIDSPDFFHNVTQLSHLDLSANQLRHLDPSAFKGFHDLQVLYLSDNFYLDFTTCRKAVFNIKSLRWLDLSNAYAGKLPDDVFRKYPLRQLRRLRLRSVDLRTWNATAFQYLENLELLELSSNDMRYITTTHIHSLPSLTSLILLQNDLYFFPKSCQDTRSIFPRLEWLDLKGNRITHLSKGVCLPKLRVLDLRLNPITSLVTNMFSADKFPALNCLHLANLEVWNGIHPYAFNNSAVRYLDFMYNNVDFNIEDVAHDSFRGLPNLQLLQLEHNYISNHRFMELFSGLSALQYVYIGNTNMDTLRANTFASFPDLQKIALHRNFFWTIPDGVFDGLPYLRKVDLSNCMITTIGQDTFSSDTRRRLTHLDLSGNHFHCDCHLLWFRDWLQSNDSVFNVSYTQYTCSNIHKTLVADFHMNEQVCLMSRDASVFTVVVVSLLMIILTLVAVVFRYRWSIRLLLYEAFRGKGRNPQLPANYFRYDLFVSYAEENVSWVRQHLVPVLEGGLGVRLCIHQRDFTPGQNIVDNIYHSVQDSRKVLMVFSRPFARSQWCQFELALCLSHVVEHDDTLLIACVDDVTGSAELTPTMMAVLNTTTYIQWAPAHDAQAAFWGRIKMALADIAPAARK